MIPSELEIIKKDFEKRILELGKKIEQLEEEKMQLELDVDIQKLEWEKKFQDARVQEDALERDLLERQNEKVGLRDRVTELESSLYQYRSHNSAIELKASLNKIEELKGKIEKLETAIRDRDHIMGKVVTQVREVADHFQTLAVQVDMLSLKYESKLDR
ncbi:hypothetical protein Gotur_027629, partial [Gossypium turneri]